MYTSVTDGDDSEETIVSHAQCDPDSARQGSTSDKDHDAPSENVCKKHADKGPYISLAHEQSKCAEGFIKFMDYPYICLFLTLLYATSK